MQTAAPTFIPLPPQNSYQPLSEAEIYAIKRQYLGLLPPQQVIDICLTFEAHAPLHVKGSVWPYDIRAAIASIQAQKAQSSQPQTCSGSDAPSKTSAPDGDDSSGEKTAQTQSSSSQSTLTPTQTGSSASASSSAQPVASRSSIPPTSTAQGSHYHHPYHHPSYPHAPYYTPPPATYGYPYPYPQPPAMYSVNHHPPLFTNTPLGHPPHPAPEPAPPLSNADDLPSYEEMIVEALLDSGDSEGCAPKSLFSWMAMHYPLQTNFRPSASQALQKAYKRGRLEKGSNGKYRLSENWEGGNTSKRTTRRPQTLAQTVLPGGPHPPLASPMTHAPLLAHGAGVMQTRLPPSGQPPGYGRYPFAYAYQSASGSAQVVARDSSGTASQKHSTDGVDREIGEGSDAWEAAQNILKAINFGQLFQISNEENKAGEPSTSGDPHCSKATADGHKAVSGAFEQSAGSRMDGGKKSVELNAEQRAALQAQLALLAAQLAELADVSEDELTHELEVSQRIITTSDVCMARVPSEDSVLGESDDGDNEDMVEVPVPMASLTAQATYTQ